MKFNIGLHQLYIFNIPSRVSFGHFYMSFHKRLSGMPYILRKNISKFVFENSWFQIADAFQSLLCDGRFAAVVNKSRRCHRDLKQKKMTWLYVDIYTISMPSVLHCFRPLCICLGIFPNVEWYNNRTWLFQQQTLKYLNLNLNLNCPKTFWDLFTSSTASAILFFFLEHDSRVVNKIGS